MDNFKGCTIREKGISISGFIYIPDVIFIVIYSYIGGYVTEHKYHKIVLIQQNVYVLQYSLFGTTLL